MEEFKIFSKEFAKKIKNQSNSMEKKTNARKEKFDDILDRAVQKSDLPHKKSEAIQKNQGIRHNLVNKYRSELKSGAYNIKASEIADKIIQKISDDKNKYKT